MSGIGVNIGQRPRNLRQRAVKVLWTAIWLVYLSAPVSDLLHGGHAAGVRALGWLGLAVFVTWYMLLVFRAGRGDRTALVLGSLAVLTAQSALLALTLGREWLVLFVYVSIASGAALPSRLSRWSVPGACALMTAAAFAVPGGRDLLWGLLVPALLGGFAMTGVRELIRTTIALREARATVAHLAANEERLRLARDLHDLLGHSLSVITIKSELAGRMLPDHPDRAARQVADIEQVTARRWSTSGRPSPATVACASRANWAVRGWRCARRGSYRAARRGRPRRGPRGCRVRPRLGAAGGRHQRRPAQRRPALHGGGGAPPHPRRPGPRTLRGGQRSRRLRHRPRQRSAGAA